MVPRMSGRRMKAYHWLKPCHDPPRAISTLLLTMMTNTAAAVRPVAMRTSRPLRISGDMEAPPGCRPRPSLAAAVVHICGVHTRGLRGKKRPHPKLIRGRGVGSTCQRATPAALGTLPNRKPATNARVTNIPWLDHYLFSACGCFATSSGGRLRMSHSVTVMNAKGGVGKTTLVLTLAETLSAYHQMKVLVVDSDAHASLSTMLLPGHWLETIQGEGRTFVDFLIASVLEPSPASWQTFVVSGVSDVDDARSIGLLMGGGHLTLFEREVSKGGHEAALRLAIRNFLAEARTVYDLILIDSAPGLSVLTEGWLREADFCLSPAKPDYLSPRGLQLLQQFGSRDTEMGFAENLGVVISMKDPHAPEDEQFDRWLRQNIKARCFKQTIPRTTALQTAAYFSVRRRSFAAKYQGKTGRVLRDLASEFLERLAEADARRAQAAGQPLGGPGSVPQDEEIAR